MSSCPPRVGAAVQRILIALLPGLVSGEHGGGAGKGVQQQDSQHQSPPCQVISGRGKPGLSPFRLALRRGIAAQKGQDPGRIVSAQKVHGTVEGGGRIILPKGFHAVAEGGGIAAQQPVHGCLAEGVAHESVGLPGPGDSGGAGRKRSCWCRPPTPRPKAQRRPFSSSRAPRSWAMKLSGSSSATSSRQPSAPQRSQWRTTESSPWIINSR